MKADDLAKCIEALGGIATSAQLKKAGFGPGHIDYAVRSGRIDRLTRGVYCSVDVLDDDFAAVCTRWRKCVLSHGSALYLLGLSDRVPAALDVTVPYGYNPRSLKTENPGIRVHHVSPELYGLGVRSVKTPSGNLARVYDAERSLADLMRARSRGGVDAQLVRDAVRGYFRAKKRDLTYLSKICDMVGVRNELQVYLEVLA